jgi:uncharacterized membrane protein
MWIYLLGILLAYLMARKIRKEVGDDTYIFLLFMCLASYFTFIVLLLFYVSDLIQAGKIKIPKWL